MRKKQKMQAEEMIRLLGKRHDQIQKAVDAGEPEKAMDLLAWCQEQGIRLGEMIEETQKEDCASVALLETYCERVYEVYEAVGQCRQVNGRKAVRNLRRVLAQMEDSVKHDIHVRREAVFLPYKASMWDSLESVWKAADEDPDCDAYVIPIPYYTKNLDGSFCQMHYEKDQYPAYVPVTGYEDYDFAKRQPDVIFIHNAYDDCNYLTSVHPFFYSRNLRKFTEKLVYIPYFLWEEVEPDDKEAVEKMEHLCTVPGVLYADQVIVQSEKMQQIYVNVMTKLTKNTSADETYWSKKILGCGSPKVDRVLYAQKDKVKVPKEWLDVIKREDGSRKTVIFYNTSISALLESGEREFEKMRDVFRVFEENRDKAALLWRPHPLIKAAIEAMKPELRQEYEELVCEYRKAGWGIYDDTPDVDRAIALCDAYYGDPSSLVRLCEEAGKPVMVQNVEVRCTSTSLH